ncbi:MAG: ABC transporter ATP-binding protein [Solirubrobacterales bacterium]|nr:ABC transporter ATP-binding protein [Solirubrobacterales bacterium]
MSKDYGAGSGVFDLDLEVRAGEVFGFLGPNGAGKSTTMRMLLGLIAPTGGSACILGRDCRADGLEIRRRVGYLPGDFAMYPRLTGAEMLGHLAELRGGTSAAVRKALADRFGAELDRPIGELSTGNRQKIGLISAFMHEPEVLILDEPIAGLDPLVQQSFHALLDETAARGGTILLSSHTLSEVERVADRVAILRRGRLAEVDTLENLRQVAVHRLEVDMVGGRDSDSGLAGVPGVKEVRREGDHLLISYEGSADPLIKALAAHDVSAIRSRDDDLEEVFLDLYRDRGEGS